MSHFGVIGGGVAGLAMAHALAKRGHTVTVFEQTSSFHQKASFEASSLSMIPHPMGRRVSWWRQVSARQTGQAGLVYGPRRALRYAKFLRHYARCSGPEWLDGVEYALGQINVRLSEQLALHPELLNTNPVIGIEAQPPAFTWSISVWARNLREACSSLGVNLLSNQCVTDFLMKEDTVVGVMSQGQAHYLDHVICANDMGALALVPPDWYNAVPVAPITRAYVQVPLNPDRPDVVPSHYEMNTGRSMTASYPSLRVMGPWTLGTESEMYLEQQYQALWQWGLDTDGLSGLWNQARYRNSTILTSPDGLPLIQAHAKPGVSLWMAPGPNGAQVLMALLEDWIQAIHSESYHSTIDALSPYRFKLEAWRAPSKVS